MLAKVLLEIEGLGICSKFSCARPTLGATRPPLLFWYPTLPYSLKAFCRKTRIRLYLRVVDALEDMGSSEESSRALVNKFVKQVIEVGTR